MRKGCLLLPLLLLGACRPQPEGLPTPEKLPAVQVDLSTSQPKVGEHVDLHLRVSAKERLVLPPVSEWIDPAIEVLSQSSDSVSNDDIWTEDHHLTLSLFQVTNLSLFAKTKIATLAEPPEEIDLPFTSIEVQSVLTDEDTSPKFGNDTLPDFRGSEALRRRKRNMIISAIAVWLTLLTAAIIWWRLSRRPKPLPPPVPPAQIALRDMEILSQSEAWKLPDVDACAVQLSLILRTYIENRFDIQAPDQTTEEFLELAEIRAPWPESNQAGLKQFFAVTDQIKYAAARPGADVLEDLLAAARAFVNSTPLTMEENRI
jgi:hypothetical protein